MATPAKGTWAKSSPALIERFRASLPDDPRVQPRQMFGYPCAFVNGNLFSGLHEHRLIVRLGETDRTLLTASAGAAPCVIMGRTMREYVMIENALDRDAGDVAGWVHRALEHTAALPPKAAKASTKKVAANKPGAKAAARKPATARGSR